METIELSDGLVIVSTNAGERQDRVGGQFSLIPVFIESSPMTITYASSNPRHLAEFWRTNPDVPTRLVEYGQGEQSGPNFVRKDLSLFP